MVFIQFFKIKCCILREVWSCQDDVKMLKQGVLTSSRQLFGVDYFSGILLSCWQLHTSAHHWKRSPLNTERRKLLSFSSALQVETSIETRFELSRSFSGALAALIIMTQDLLKIHKITKPCIISFNLFFPGYITFLTCNGGKLLWKTRLPRFVCLISSHEEPQSACSK